MTKRRYRDPLPVEIALEERLSRAARLLFSVQIWLPDNVLTSRLRQEISEFLSEGPLRRS